MVAHQARVKATSAMGSVQHCTGRWLAKASNVSAYDIDVLQRVAAHCIINCASGDSAHWPLENCRHHAAAEAASWPQSSWAKRHGCCQRDLQAA